MEKRLEPWNDFLLEDREGEEWRDVIGFDGYYQVSNHGRVKSLQRYTRNGLKVKEKILKANKNNGTVIMCVDLMRHQYNAGGLVCDAFIRLREDHEWVIHKNKITYDNRLENLKIGTRSESFLLDYKMGIRNEVLSITQRISKDSYEEKFFVYENGHIIEKVCVSCMTQQPAEEFYEWNGIRNKKCKTCIAKRTGILEIGKRKTINDLFLKGLRKCSRCGEVKDLDNSFYKCKTIKDGRSRWCIDCKKNYIKKYNKKI
jgi:hypothetical protein